MTLEQLRIFVAVAMREHVTEAARSLHLTQSATSAAIAALEARHATKLFDRVGRRILLTEAGRIFLAEARAVLARAEGAEAVLADLAGLKTGRLILAASQTVGNYWLPARLNRFRQAFPGIDLSVTIANTEAVAEAVVAGTVELGIVEGPATEPTLAVETVGADDMVMVLPPDHDASALPIASNEAMADLPWITREAGSGTRLVMETLLETRGIRPGSRRIVLELPTNEAILSAVEAGAGVAILSRLVAQRAVECRRVAILDIGLGKRPFLALRHRERHQTRAAAEFLQALRRNACAE